MNRSRLLLIFILCLIASGSWADETPRIVVTIKPIHSIVNALLEGISEPELLLDGLNSPHTYSLKPSDARKLEDADMIIWVGPTLEGYLRKIIEVQRDKSLVITLLDRTHQKDSSNDTIATHLHDPHLWLDPTQLISLVPALAQEISKLIPEQQNAIRINMNRLLDRLENLDRQIEHQFKTRKQLSAIAYHDAWHYFEERYGLKISGVISTHEQQHPGANHLYHLQQQIKIDKIKCLLVEPQYQPKYLDALIADQPIHLVEADPLGAAIQSGPNAYFEIMQRISDTFEQCLKD